MEERCDQNNYRVYVTVSRLPFLSLIFVSSLFLFSSLTVTLSLLHSLRESKGRPATTPNQNNNLLTSLILVDFLMNSVGQNIKLSHPT